MKDKVKQVETLLRELQRGATSKELVLWAQAARINMHFYEMVLDGHTPMFTPAAWSAMMMHHSLDAMERDSREMTPENFAVKYHFDK